MAWEMARYLVGDFKDGRLVTYRWRFANEVIVTTCVYRCDDTHFVRFEPPSKPQL